MIIIEKDNIEEFIDNESIHFIGVNNNKKYPRITNQIKKITEDLETKFPSIKFFYMNGDDNPKSMDLVFKGGVEYYPLFGILEGNDLVGVYFGRGVEETYNFLKKFYENND